MNITMIQVKQNKLYHFINRCEMLDIEQAKVLQQEMIDQNIKLIERAIEEKTNDLIITTEAINYPGQPIKIQGDYLELIPEKNSPIFLDVFKYLAKKAKSYLVVGAYYKEIQGNGMQLWNGAFLFNREGELVSIYNKVHLVGEEKEYLQAGKQYVVYDTDFGKMGICICWDMQFPEVARELSLRGAELIACCTWGWEAIYGHARAYENGIYIAAAMAIPYWMSIEGKRHPSEVIDPLGEIVAQASYTEAGYTWCEVDLKKYARERKIRLNDRMPHTYTKLN